MRISDWSSDVLLFRSSPPSWFLNTASHHLGRSVSLKETRPTSVLVCFIPFPVIYGIFLKKQSLGSSSPHYLTNATRPEERRVGKERVITCRSRWSPEP